MKVEGLKKSVAWQESNQMWAAKILLRPGPNHFQSLMDIQQVNKTLLEISFYLLQSCKLHCEKNNLKTVEAGEQLVDLSFYPYFFPECS